MSEYNKLVYIAGPFRAETLFEIEKNVMRAREYAAAVWKAGAVGVCPHSNTGFSFQGLVPDDAWLKGDLEILRRCDAIVMMPGWRESSGSRAEHELSKKLGIEILDCDVNKVAKIKPDEVEFMIKKFMIKKWIEDDEHSRPS